MKMWSGRFRQPLDPEFERWQRSFDFDRRLLRYELAASGAHARALKDAGVLSSDELIAILQGSGRNRRASGRRRLNFSTTMKRKMYTISSKSSWSAADWRDRIQAAQRTQPKRADCYRLAAICAGGD